MEPDYNNTTEAKIADGRLVPQVEESSIPHSVMPAGARPLGKYLYAIARDFGGRTLFFTGWDGLGKPGFTPDFKRAKFYYGFNRNAFAEHDVRQIVLPDGTRDGIHVRAYWLRHAIPGLFDERYRDPDPMNTPPPSFGACV